MNCPKCGGTTSPALPGCHRAPDGKVWHTTCFNWTYSAGTVYSRGR